MKKGFTLTLFIVLQIMAYHVQGQNLFLESLDEIIITPENVNVHYEEQIEYYTKKYQTLINDLTDKRASYQLEIEEIESKKKTRKKDAKYIDELKPLIATLREDIKVLKACISLWTDLEVLDNENVEHLSLDKCYDITAKTYVYSPEEYMILEVYPDEILTWYELTESIEIEEVETIPIEPATAKWVRKKVDENCLSRNPDDCLIWCLVEVPAVTQIIIKRIKECPLGFENEVDNICVREVDVDNGKSTKRLRIMDITMLTEIRPVSFEESDCE